MSEPLPSDLEICRFCEGGSAMSPAECPECEGEVMVRYEKPTDPLPSNQDADSLAAYMRWFALNGHSNNTWLAWQAAVAFMRGAVETNALQGVYCEECRFHDGRHYPECSQYSLKRTTQKTAFVTYDKHGGVTVDLAAYLQSPEGQEQLRLLQAARHPMLCGCKECM